MKNDVFISYSSKDTFYVEKIKESLEDRGIKCWMANAFTITNGEDFRDRIMSALNDSTIILLVLSENSMTSNWVQLEITQALLNNKKIYTLKIDNHPIDELLSFKLGCSQIADCTSNVDAVIESLSINIKKERDSYLEKERQKLVKTIEKESFLTNFAVETVLRFISYFLVLGIIALVFVYFLVVLPIAKKGGSDISEISGLYSGFYIFVGIILLIVTIIRIVIHSNIKRVAKNNGEKSLFYMYQYHIGFKYFFIRKKEFALECLKQSANLGYHRAYYELAKLYEKGKYVEKDLVLSSEYLKKGKMYEEAYLKSRYVK